MANIDEFFYVIDGEQNKITGANFFDDPSFNLYSPRTVSLVIDKVCYPGKNENVTYISNRKYENIYDFIFACRVSKNSKKVRFANGDFSNLDEVRRARREYYILVSGDKLPDDIPYEEKLLIQRYMFYGLMQLNLFEERNLKESGILKTKTEAFIVSLGNHPFQKKDTWAMNTSNLFLGMLIDYYEITTGIQKQDSERSFCMNSNYRKFLYNYLTDLFIKFIQTNSDKEFNGPDMNISTINSEVVKILNNYI